MASMDDLKARIQEILDDFHVGQAGSLGRISRRSWLPHNHYYVSRKSKGGRVTEPVRERQVAMRQMRELQSDAIIELMQGYNG